MLGEYICRLEFVLYYIKIRSPILIICLPQVTSPLDFLEIGHEMFDWHNETSTSPKLRRNRNGRSLLEQNIGKVKTNEVNKYLNISPKYLGVIFFHQMPFSFPNSSYIFNFLKICHISLMTNEC